MKRGNRVWLLLSVMVLCSPSLMAAQPEGDNWQTDGLNGGIHAWGSLISAPCILAPESTEQDVSLGDASRWTIELPGSVTTPVTFHLVLEKCPGGPSLLRSPQQMQGAQWLSGQSGVRLTVTGDADPYDNRYFRLRGSAKGVALRLEDARGEWLQPAMVSRPLPLNPGRNELALKAQLWRNNRTLLEAGEVYGVVNIGMEYQ